MNTKNSQFTCGMWGLELLRFRSVCLLFIIIALVQEHREPEPWPVTQGCGRASMCPAMLALHAGVSDSTTSGKAKRKNKKWIVGPGSWTAWVCSVPRCRLRLVRVFCLLFALLIWHSCSVICVYCLRVLTSVVDLLDTLNCIITTWTKWVMSAIVYFLKNAWFKTFPSKQHKGSRPTYSQCLFVIAITTHY